MEKTKGPNCYTCKWRRDIPGDAHSKCVHPVVEAMTKDNPIGDVLSRFGGKRLGGGVLETPLNVKGHEYGKAKGWFMWPFNFDPTWLLACDGHEEKEEAIPA